MHEIIDQGEYNKLIRYIEGASHKHGKKLQKVRELAHMVREGIEKISPFIQQSTEAVCPKCENVCCINKHGYYNFEDLVYINALGLKPPEFDFGREDSTLCQFLSDRGCSLDRSVRPSGCNWYFCEFLLDHMEERPEYGEFDNDLRDIAELWLKLMAEFEKVIKGMETGD